MVLYIHGKGGSADESAHFIPLFPHDEVKGIEWKSSTPWGAGAELHAAVADAAGKCEQVILVANSIGAYFSMHADIESFVRKAYFISPIVDMEGLILGMMRAEGVSESQLEARGVIPTLFGEDLRWDYLSYVREHLTEWSVPTEILYGERDTFTPQDTMRRFAAAHGAGLTVIKDGEHWFHTPWQMRALDDWIQTC